MIEVYFDESESDKHKILCLAGYLFRKEKALVLKQKWASILKEKNLRYFHMVECAHNDKGFAHLSAAECIEVQTRLMDLLKEHMEIGFSVTFDMQFAHLCPSAFYLGGGPVDPYTLCCYWCLMVARKWSADHKFDGEVEYFFEAGHKSERQAAQVMREIFMVPEMKETYQYAGHSFLPKNKAVLLQCADILAWQWRKNLADRKDGKTKSRADLLSLLEKPHFTTHFDERSIKALLASIRKTNRKIEARKNQPRPNGTYFGRAALGDARKCLKAKEVG